MLFFWHGFGWLILVFLGVFFGIVDVLFRHAHYGSEASAGGFAYICTGIACWFVGRHLRNYTKPITDKQSGETIRVKQPYHALFFIPMHFWAPILSVVGVVMLANSPPTANTSYQTSWKHQTIGYLSFDSPGDLIPSNILSISPEDMRRLTPEKLKILETTRSATNAMDAYEFKVSGFNLQVQRIIYKDGLDLDLDGAASGAINGMAQETGGAGFEHSETATMVSGHPAKHVNFTIAHPSKHMVGQAMICLDGQTLWQIFVIYNDDYPDGQQFCDRIMQSLTLTQ